MEKKYFKKNKLNITPDRVRQIFEDYSKIYFKIDWSNPESVIYFHQSIYRLFSLVNFDYQILHGSATVTPSGKVVVFGDDGKSIGKTTCAFEIARHSKKWIADEFILYHKGRIFANDEYPLHFKDGSKDYFKSINRKFNNWVYPRQESWKIVSDVKVDAIICPVLSGKNEIRRLKRSEANRARRTTAFAHMAKLIDPSLDRLSIFTGSNDKGATTKDLCDIADSFDRFKSRIPVFELQFKHSGCIIPLLKKNNLY